MQLYRHDRLRFLELSHKIAQEQGFKLGVKLVRGAYMEKERTKAAERGQPSLIQKDKAATDADFNAAVRYCLDHVDTIAVIIASHNEESNLLAAKLIHEKNIPHH
ncbi:proline dehydrogenase family protein, partial [Shewanella algae]|uniref:proline dehydrogenase family protein n=1 Tax=Shewanella algae TaxID=38313 RepID=UPI00313C2E4F